MGNIDGRVVAWWTCVVAVAFAINAPTLFTWLSTQNPTVQAAIYAPAIALVGVIINTWVSGWNTSRQLEQAREQDERKTSLDLSRDIFLGVADHIDNAMTTIVAFADLQLEHKDIVERLQRCSHFVARMQLVGSLELNRELALITAAVSAAIVRIRIGREKVMVTRQQHQDMVTSLLDHRRRASEAKHLYHQKGLEGTLDQAEVDRLQKIDAGETAAGDALVEPSYALLAKLRREHWLLQREAMDQQQKVRMMLGNTVKVARAALGFTTDAEEYAALLQSVAEMREAYAADLEQLFAGPSNEGPKKA